MEIQADTLERLVPDELDPSDRAGQETLQLHFERYDFAAENARPGRLLDMACGVGYGTSHLVGRCEGLEEAIGVDLSPSAIEYANGHYAGGHLRYVNADAMRFEDEAGFDTIVSLETVEHLPEPAQFMARIAKLLRPMGVLIASVPVTPSVDLNPHHLHDFTSAGFRRMGAELGLEPVAEHLQVQRVRLGELSGGQRFKRENLRANLPSWYMAHPGALVRRVVTTLRHGFANHYLTIAWRRPG